MSTTAPSLPSSAERPTNLRHFVLLSLLIITTINYMQRNCMGTAATTIQKSTSLNLGVEAPEEKKQRLDSAMAAFFWSYTFMMVPASLLSAYWGPRLALSVFAGGWSLVTLACAFVTGFYDLWGGRILLGALQAGIFPCATLIIAVWYRDTQRGLATSLLNSFMLIGSAFGGMLTGWLLVPLGKLLDGTGPLMDQDGWRGVFALFALPGVIWAVWFYWWFRNRPEEHPGVNAAELALLQQDRPAPKKGQSSGVPWLLILTSVPLLLLFTQQSFRAGANRLFDSRLPTYFEEQRLLPEVNSGFSARVADFWVTGGQANATTPFVLALQSARLDSASEELKKRSGQAKAEAGTLASLPQWAGVIGGVFGGSLSDWVLRRTRSRRLARNGVALFSLLSAVAVYLLAYPIENVWLAASVLSLGAFLFCFSSPCAYALTIDVGGKHLAVIFGLMNMIGNLGAALFVENISKLVVFGGNRGWFGSGWDFLFVFWIGMHLVAAVCWIFLDPNANVDAAANKPTDPD